MAEAAPASEELDSEQEQKQEAEVVGCSVKVGFSPAGAAHD